MTQSQNDRNSCECLLNVGYGFAPLLEYLIQQIHEMGFTNVSSSNLLDWLYVNDYMLMTNRQAGYFESYLTRLHDMLCSTTEATLHILSLLKLEDDLGVVSFLQNGLGVWTISHRQSGQQHSVFLPVQESEMTDAINSMVSLVNNIN